MNIQPGDIRYTQIRQAYRKVRVIKVKKTSADVAFSVPSSHQTHVQSARLENLHEEPRARLQPPPAPSLEVGLQIAHAQKVWSLKRTIRWMNRKLESRPWEREYDVDPDARYGVGQPAQRIPWSAEHQEAERQKILNRKAAAERKLAKLQKAA